MNALVKRLDCLIRDEHLCEAMGKKGRAYVELHHHADTLNDRLVTLYEQVMDGLRPDQ